MPQNVMVIANLALGTSILKTWLSNDECHDHLSLLSTKNTNLAWGRGNVVLLWMNRYMDLLVWDSTMLFAKFHVASVSLVNWE